MKKANGKKYKKILLVLIVIIQLVSFIIPQYIYAEDDENDPEWEEFGGKFVQKIFNFICGIGDAGIQFLQNRFITYNMKIFKDGKYRIYYSPGIIFSGMVRGLDINFLDPLPPQNRRTDPEADRSYITVGVFRVDWNQDTSSTYYDVARYMGPLSNYPGVVNDFKTFLINNGISEEEAQNVEELILNNKIFNKKELEDSESYSFTDGSKLYEIFPLYGGGVYTILLTRVDIQIRQKDFKNIIFGPWEKIGGGPYFSYEEFNETMKSEYDCPVDILDKNGDVIAPRREEGGYYLIRWQNDQADYQLAWKARWSDEELYSDYIQLVFPNLELPPDHHYYSRYFVLFSREIKFEADYWIPKPRLENVRNYAQDAPLYWDEENSQLTPNGLNKIMRDIYGYDGDILSTNEENATLFNGHDCYEEFEKDIYTIWEYNGKVYKLELGPTGMASGYDPLDMGLIDKNDDFFYFVTSYDGELTYGFLLQIAHPKSSKLISIAEQLRPTISSWYKGLRTVSIVSLLPILLYIGIRIVLSSKAGDKAKYKKMFMDWLTALLMLFILHYLMILILTITSKIGGIFNLVGEHGEDVLMSQIRMNTLCASTPRESFANALMYLALVVLTYIFTFQYLKRVIYMAFLTMIAPLIAFTYPIDKIKDNKAQAFSMWLKEYMFNAMIQPVHLLIYVMLVDSAQTLVMERPLYGIIAIGFITPAEKFFRKMFGFDKAETVGQLGAAAGGAMIMNAINKLKEVKGHGSSNDNNSPSKGNATNIRTANQNGPGVANGNAQNGTNGGQTGSAQARNAGANNAAQSTGAAATSTANRSATGGTTKAKIQARRKIGGVIKAVGKRYKLWGSGSLRQWNKRVAGLVGAGTMAMIGGAAGLATGDLSNVLKYGGAAGAAGYAGARGLVDKVAEDGSGLIDTIKKGAQGEKL